MQKHFFLLPFAVSAEPHLAGLVVTDDVHKAVKVFEYILVFGGDFQLVKRVHVEREME